MNMICRCGPRTSTRFFASDAARAPRKQVNDPTGTMPIQRRFSKDLNSRWNALRRTVPNFVTARTDLATTISHAAITGQDPVRAFQKWFDTAVKMVVVGDGRWMNKYVREAGDAAIMRAGTLTQAVQDADFDEDKHPRDEHGRWTQGSTHQVVSETNFISSIDRFERAKSNKSIIRRLIPALYVYKKGGEYDEETGTIVIGHRGDWHADVAKRHGLGYISKSEKFTPGFVDPKTKDFYVRGGGLDANELAGLQGIKTAYDAAPITHDRIPPLQTLAHTELQGIAEATSQQAVRAFAHGLLVRATPGQIARDIQAIIDKVAKQRSDLLVSFIVVRAFGAATLDTYRAVGITHVGTVAERIQSPPSVVRDAKPSAKSKGKKLPKDLVEVLTAGDDKVCSICEDISEEGPYTLKEAEGLIPAHPRCRCSFVPWHDARFAHDAWSDNARAAALLSRTHGSHLLHEIVHHVGHHVAHEVGHHVGHHVREVFVGERAHEEAHEKLRSEGYAHEDTKEEKTTSAQVRVSKFSHPDGHEAEVRTRKKVDENGNPVTRAVVRKRVVQRDEFTEGLHPRDKDGKFAHKGAIDMQDLVKISGKKGSNEGGVYADDLEDKKYYIKTPKSKDHVQNELTAAALYRAADVNTMEYVPVKGGEHVATVLQPLQKNNVSHFTADERHKAQEDFAVHAWLANHDAVGTGGDNQVLDQFGKVTTVDTGGSLKYRAQGDLKHEFGDKVVEINTMRQASLSPDAAGLYGNMTNEQIKKSIARVTAIPDSKIEEIVKAHTDNETTATLLAHKLIARKNDLAAQAAKMTVPAAAALTPLEVHAAEPKIFKTKMEHAKHLLMQGTTSEELKSKLGWPSINVPGTAEQAGLKLEKTKQGGKFFYKGTPMSAAEIAAAKIVGKTSAETPTVVPITTSAFDPEPSVKHDLTTPVGNFKQSLENSGVQYSSQESVGAGGHFITLDKPTDVSKASEVAHWHPKVEKLSAHEYFAPSSAATTPAKTEPTFPPATLDELAKAKKNTKLTAQYVPGAIAGHPESEKLIAEFNKKYEGKTLDDDELTKKVHDFKKLQADLIPVAAQAKANEVPDFADEESERLYWYNKHVGESSYMHKAEAIFEGHGSKATKLKSIGATAAEVAYIKAFTGSYSHVNANLTKGFMEPGEFAFKHIMNDALDKFPKYDGDKVWRKIQLTPNQQAEYVVGQIAHWKQFSSTSKNDGTWSGNTHFIIHKPKSGVDVEFISSNPNEAEVIMPADTYYMVKSKKQVGDQAYIEMEEVIPFGKKKKKAA